MEEHKNKLTLPSAIIIAGALVALAVILKWNPPTSQPVAPAPTASAAEALMVDGGHLLPIDSEQKLLAEVVKAGVLDPSKLSQVTELNLLWAFGLANKDQVLEKGPMMDPRYGGPQKMASVGGWTVSMGDPMNHYSMHEFVVLTPEQQALVEKVSKQVFRPCCRNSTYFPDCNHGMAMLGLLEIWASRGLNEQDLLTEASKANAIWFPAQQQSGCGVETGQPQVTPTQPSSCGI